MSNVKTVGKISWDSDEADIGGSVFVRLDEGESHIRLVSSPYQFYSHYTKDASGMDRKVKCAVNDCPLCQQGEKASARWYVAVLNRANNKLGILEIGPQIFKAVLSLSKNKKWGDPRQYDLAVTRAPKGTNPLYTVMPEPKELLTEEEKVMIKEFASRVDLASMVVAPTPDEIREKLGMAKKVEAAKPVVNDDFDEPAVPEVSEPVAEVANEDEDFNFDA